MREDPIAQLRVLDPADEKEIDALLVGLESRDALARSVAPRTTSTAGWHPPRMSFCRVRLALVAAGAVVAAIVVVALAANPFSGNGAISSAQAKAKAAKALDLQGGWHFTRVAQSSFNGRGTAKPHWSDAITDDVWHAPDGRLVITTTDPTGGSSTWLYTNGERRSYDTRSNLLTIHRFAGPSDLRDEQRTYLPPTAADLYRAAYRVGKVRLAGVETIGGRQVYRLAFDWLDVHYTLVFDADRQVPISSTSQIPNGPKRFFFTRVRYTAYQRVQPGADLDQHLVLPSIPADAKTRRENPVLISKPVQGALATSAMRAIEAHSLGGFPAYASLARARWIAVRPLPGGGSFAAAIIPAAGGNGNACYAFIEIPRRGGAVRPVNGGCPTGIGFTPSQDGNRMLVSGFTQAQGIELRFANGTRVRPLLRDGVVLAAPRIGLFRYALSIVRTYPHGVVRTEKLPWRPWGGGLPSWLTR